MRLLNVQSKKTDFGWEMSLEGSLDERAKLPLIEDGLPLQIDLDGVEHINSSGVAHWVRWAETHQKSSLIILKHARPLFVRNLNAVNGFLKPNMRVESFYVPYVSGDGKQRRDILFQLGRDYKSDGMLNPRSVTDDKGFPMEMDILPAAYFKFLSKVGG